jgi:hypothetical protein
MNTPTAVRFAVPMLVGVGVSFTALFLAVSLVGPAARAIFGNPAGFGLDYATRSAWLEATAVRVISVGVLFLIVGALAAHFRLAGTWTKALLMANPLNVGVAYWFYQECWSGHFAGEYFGFMGMAVVALLAPILSVLSFMTGFRIGNRRR